MSTYIKFKDGSTVHILDVCVAGMIHHKFVEKGIVYERERTAIMRAFRTYRKKLYNSCRIRRHRKKVQHQRRVDKVLMDIVRPAIYSYMEDGIEYHQVVETGKRFKKLELAINNAINYYVRNRS